VHTARIKQYKHKIRKMSRRKYIGIYGATGYAIEQKLLNPWEELPQPMEKIYATYIEYI
jgi:hypothetical protein